MRGGNSQRTSTLAPGGAPPASHRPPTAPPRRARAFPDRARAVQPRPCAPGGLRSAQTHSTTIYMCLRPAYQGPPGSPPPPVEHACARSIARARRASPALRPVLPGTRRRKRRRGPFGPEVDQSCCACAFGKEVMTRKSLRARRSPGRSAPAPAASQRDPVEPTSVPIGLDMRAWWRIL